MSTADQSFLQAAVPNLPQLVVSGWVTASLTWDDDTAQQWGCDLVDVLADFDVDLANHGSTLNDYRAIVTALLDGDGLNPQVALGAFDRVEEICTTDPDALATRSDDPTGALWQEVVTFASRAAERLGGNLGLAVGTITTQASIDIAEALATFIPETAALLGSGNDYKSQTAATATILIDGNAVMVAGFTAQWGNLSRLLGVATTDTRAAAMYHAAVATYAQQAMDYIASPHHPGTDAAKDIAYGIGAVYGLAYGASAYETAKHQEEVSDTHEQALSTIATIASVIPMGSTGKAAVDYLIQVASGNITNIGGALDPSIMSDAELQATIDAGLDRGNLILSSSVTETLNLKWDGIDPPYDTTTQTLVEQLNAGYTWTAGGVTSDGSVGDLDVAIIGEDGTTDTCNRGDMP